jgi:tetratricopeptide (TPR) repeat protein
MSLAKIITATTIILSLATSIIRAQQPLVNDLLKEGKSVSQQAYSSYNKDLLLKAKSIFETAASEDKTNPLPLYYITYTDYKLLEMSLKGSDKEQFEKYYTEAEKNGLQLSETKGIESEGKTLLAAIYMIKIANNPMSAVSLAQQILDLLDDAERLDASNPRVYIIRGSMKYNMPSMFGGSFEAAADNFRKSVSLFEKEEISDSLRPSWGYLESLAWLGRSYEQLKNYDSAKFIYQKALSIEPEFGWIKYSLLPTLEKKMAEQTN